MKYTFQDSTGIARTDSCSTSLQTAKNSIDLTIESNASEIGYLRTDEDAYHQFACQILNKPAQSPKYKIEFTIKNEKTGVVDSVATSRLVFLKEKNGNTFIVDSYFFEDEINYTVTCKAQTSDGSLKGTAVRQFTTKAYLFDFEFGIDPADAISIDLNTVVHMWVNKKPNSLMDCQFGYLYNYDDQVRIDVNQSDSFNFTNEKQ